MADCSIPVSGLYDGRVHHHVQRVLLGPSGSIRQLSVLLVRFTLRITAASRANIRFVPWGSKALSLKPEVKLDLPQPLAMHGKARCWS